MTHIYSLQLHNMVSKSN